MSAQPKSLAFAPIADRLSKLIPRLASDQVGEVVATAAAIGRTLASAGLDWHDLTARLTGQTIADLVAKADARSAHCPRSAEREAEFQGARKPKREPSPWPTWGTLSHFGRLGMLEVVMAEAAFTEAEAESMTAFRAAYYRRGILPGSKIVRLFNAACRNLWERGWRPEEKAA